MEVRQYHQYIIRMDGSGRVTLRNRHFLRKYIPVVPREPIMNIPGNAQRCEIPQTAKKPLPPAQNFQPEEHPLLKPTPESNPPNLPPLVRENSDTPQRVVTKIYRRSLHDKSPSPENIHARTQTAMSPPHQKIVIPTSPNTSNVPESPTAQAA